MAIELVKENIEYEQLLGENSADNMVKAEYVIPDILPDVKEVLILDAKPSIISTEVMQGKVYIEGQIVYNILYASREERNELFSVTYVGKFTNYIQVDGAAHKMVCDTECLIEHMECVCINERKISIEGIIKTKARVNENCYFDIVKDIMDSQDVQLLKNPITIDKLAGVAKGNLLGKSHIVIPMDKPQIGTILKMEVTLHRREIKVMENKVQADTFALVEVFYKGKNERELEYVSDDILIRQEMEVEGVYPSMEGFGDFTIENIEHNIKEDDLGENRILDVELNARVDVKVMTKENINIIEDVYSPSVVLDMTKKNYEFNVVHGSTNFDTIVKENISVKRGSPKPTSVILSNGKVCVTDKKLVENKAVIDGLLQVTVLYKTEDEEKYVYSMEEEIPFICNAEIQGAKIDMNCVVKLLLESVEADVEADTISIKAVICVQANVFYNSHKDFIIDVEEVEGETPVKKSSITIYCVQPEDTMWKIAKRYNTPVDTLIKVNDIEDIDDIKVGEKFIIPGRAII